MSATTYITNLEELTSIADAIREKGGTSANLEYPAEFVSAIEAIATGVSGLVYESGTYTPTSNIAQPTINFQNSHSTEPIFVMMSDVEGDYSTTTYTNYVFIYANFYGYTGINTPRSSSTGWYGIEANIYRSNNSGDTSGARLSISSLTGNSTTSMDYYLSSSAFKPTTGATNRYWRSGRTYKWIAVWKPTT